MRYSKRCRECKRIFQVVYSGEIYCPNCKNKPNVIKRDDSQLYKMGALLEFTDDEREYNRAKVCTVCGRPIRRTSPNRYCKQCYADKFYSHRIKQQALYDLD